MRRLWAKKTAPKGGSDRKKVFDFAAQCPGQLHGRTGVGAALTPLPTADIAAQTADFLGQSRLRPPLGQPQPGQYLNLNYLNFLYAYLYIVVYCD